MNEGDFSDVVNNTLEGLANWFGAGPLVGWLRRTIFGAKAIDYQKLQDEINKVVAQNRSQGQRVLDDINNTLNKLRSIIPSVATKRVLGQAISKAKEEYNRVNKQINLAEAYENSANSLANQLSIMTENQRMSSQAKDMGEDAQNKLKKASDIYNNIASSYEKQNEIGGHKNV